LNSQRRKHVGRGKHPADFFWLFTKYEVQAHGAGHAQVGKRSVSRPPLDEIARRNHIASAPRVALPDNHDPLGIRIGQRAQDDAAHDAEDGRGRADPERKREHRGNRKARRSQKGSCGHAQIANDGAH
jgi:hypothetical protein